MDFDLEELVNVEQTFYEDGYKDGFAHGRVHGLIEGRALGREKGFEMWEELGFYEGFARMWKAILDNQGARDERVQNHIRHLLELIAHFPRVNPSSTAAADDGAAGAEVETDIPRLFRQIRSRYKLLCATLGVRPTLRASDGSPAAATADGRPDASDDPAQMAMDTDGGAEAENLRPERKKGSGVGAGRVWAVHDARADRALGGGAAELSF